MASSDAGLLDSPDPLELALLEKNVDLARETLAEAEKDLAELADGPDLVDLVLLEAKVASVQAASDEALKDLEGATVRAPFAGVVWLVNVEVDDRVHDESRIIEIVDPSIVEVEGFVEATDIQLVQEGSRAMVTIDAMGGRVLDGTVLAVATELRTERGVVSYPLGSSGVG